MVSLISAVHLDCSKVYDAFTILSDPSKRRVSIFVLRQSTGGKLTTFSRNTIQNSITNNTTTPLNHRHHRHHHNPTPAHPGETDARPKVKSNGNAPNEASRIAKRTINDYLSNGTNSGRSGTHLGKPLRLEHGSLDVLLGVDPRSHTTILLPTILQPTQVNENKLRVKKRFEGRRYKLILPPGTCKASLSRAVHLTVQLTFALQNLEAATRGYEQEFAEAWKRLDRSVQHQTPYHSNALVGKLSHRCTDIFRVSSHL